MLEKLKVPSRRGLTPEERLWRKVLRDPEGCWLWQGNTGRTGYGILNVQSAMLFVHRVSYTLTYGEIEAGHDIHHLCGVRNCVRPDHLQSLAEHDHCSMNTGPKPGWRMKTGTCKHGHAWVPENMQVYTTRSGRQSFRCKVCLRETDYRNRGLVWGAPKPARTVCRHGHPWTPDNLYRTFTKAKQPTFCCRTCKLQSVKRSQATRRKVA